MAAPFEWIRSSRVAVPVIEIIHLLAVALAIGTIMVIDLSVLGLAVRRQAVPRIARELAPWTRAGFGVVFATGILLFSAEAAKMSSKPIFWAKLVLLAGAVAFHLTAHRDLVLPANPLDSARARWTAAASLALWFAVAFGGKAIGLL
ncbi:MAG: hypothetical protein JO323_18830 [Acidobacteriia bacterium]|nr:hypothetical protein [Terriglobia bacterium]